MTNARVLMIGSAARTLSLALLVALLGACAQGSPPRSGASSASAGASSPLTAPTKRVTAAIAGSPSVLSWALAHNSGHTAAGGSALDELLNSRLVTFDDRGALQPQLADAVLTVENGRWTVYPDGRMDTTWRIRPGAAWHDGTPFTSHDVVFSARVIQAREVAVFRDVRYDQIESIEADSDRSFTVHWSRPQLQAVEAFTVPPLPRHILEPVYESSRETFTEQHYWADAFIGTGPFKVAELARGSHLLLHANEAYVAGRPNLDEILVRFVPDANALMAGILAGQIELTLGQTLSLDQAGELREQWSGGRVVSAIKNMWMADPQHLDPTPRVVASVAFRRALLHGLDRQALADSIGHGAPVADSLVSPASADYPAVQAGIVRYEYDPRRAGELIESRVRSHATGLHFLRYFFHSDVARTPERSYLGSNALRYRDPVMDSLIDRYFTTIPLQPRMDVATQAIRHLTENVVTMSLFHGTAPTVVSARLLHVGSGAERAEQTWNAAAWDVAR